MSSPEESTSPLGTRPASAVDPARRFDARHEWLASSADRIVNLGRLDLLEQLLEPEHVYHDPALDALVIGPEGLSRRLAVVTRAFPDRYLLIEELFGDADRVLVRWSLTGTHSHPLPHVPATGRRMLVTGMHLLRLTAGRVRETHASWDALGQYRQLGLFPPPRPPASHLGEQT